MHDKWIVLKMIAAVGGLLALSWMTIIGTLWFSWSMVELLIGG